MASARYDAVADFYIQGWPDTYDDSVSVSLLSVLGPVEGLSVLDVACGHGRFSREIARRGAARVVGLDLSVRLLERARATEAEEPLGVHYVCDDLATSRQLDDESFDRVSCAFGLSDVDDLAPSLSNVARVLAPRGRFVFSILHPCFPGTADVAGAWPPDSRYYDEQRWQADSPESTLRQKVGANHRTLSTYLNGLTACGLTVDAVEEPAPSPEWSAARPTAARLPLYLVVGCTKV